MAMGQSGGGRIPAAMRDLVANKDALVAIAGQLQEFRALAQAQSDVSKLVAAAPALLALSQAAPKILALASKLEAILILVET